MAGMVLEIYIFPCITRHCLHAGWTTFLLMIPLPQVALFKSMYQGYKTFDEVSDTLHINDIDLNSVADHFPMGNAEFSITPNPVSR
jgi:hypothetical protein